MSRERYSHDRQTRVESLELTMSQSSPHPSTLSPTSARSPVLRARPRLPAGPRTPKPTTLVPRESPLDATTKDSPLRHVPPLPSESAPSGITPALHPPSSDPLHSAFIPPLSSLVSPQPVNHQVERPSDPMGLDQSFPHPQAPSSPDTIQSNAPQTTLSPSHAHRPTQDYPISIQPTTPVPGVSRPATPDPLVIPSFSVTNSTLRKPPQATVSSVVAPLTLPAAEIDPTPELLPYKHITLDAAHWTFTSTELQHLVSSAIRESAKEQFIRLLPPSIIDTRMPEDEVHIERSWDTAIARWRFEAHRRNMLLRALSASGADGDLLAQLSGTLSNLDSHAQNLLHAAAHRSQLAAARGTHRASALAVALRKLNASYARRTRDLDKARAHIARLRNEVDGVWKVAEKQAAEVDKLQAAAAAAAAESHELATAGLDDSLTDDENVDEDDTSSNVVQDGASADLMRAEVVDVTGKAIAAQARLTVMRTGHRSGSHPPPSAYSCGSRTSPVESGSGTPQSRSSMTSHVSRVSAARKRSRRKSRASLRLPAAVGLRSRSTVRGEPRSARSKSRSRKGKEPAQVEPNLPWVSVDVEGSFLEMEPRLARDDAGDGQMESDGNGYDDGDASVDEPLSSTAEPTPNSPLSVLTSAPESKALLIRKADTRQSPISPSLLDNDISPAAASSASAFAPEQASRHSSGSLPSIPAMPSVASTLTFPPSEPHDQSQSLHPQSSGTDAEETVAVARGVDLIHDPAFIISAMASSESTLTTTASAPDLPQRGHSLDLPPPSSGGGGKQYNGSSKIRRSLSELLHFGTGSRTRRRSVPLPLKGHGGATGSGPMSSAIRRYLREEPQGGEGLENGWEEAHADDV